MIKCYGYYRRLLRMVLLRCDHPIDGYFCSTTNRSGQTALSYHIIRKSGACFSRFSWKQRSSQLCRPRVLCVFATFDLSRSTMGRTCIEAFGTSVFQLLVLILVHVFMPMATGRRHFDNRLRTMRGYVIDHKSVATAHVSDHSAKGIDIMFGFMWNV